MGGAALVELLLTATGCDRGKNANTGSGEPGRPGGAGDTRTPGGTRGDRNNDGNTNPGGNKTGTNNPGK